MIRHPEANVFVTTAADAAAGGLTAKPDGVHGIQSRWIEMNTIAALQFFLLGKEGDYDDELKAVCKPEVFVYDEMHGGWLFQLADTTVKLLAGVTDDQRQIITSKWYDALVEEFGYPPERHDVATMLDQFVCLANTALREQKSMYWLQHGC